MQEFLNSFVQQYNNKPADFDGYYGAQCMDLVNFWAKYLGLPSFWGNAIDLARQGSTRWAWVANTPTGVPPAGAVVVWGQSTKAGTTAAGHTGIALTGATGSFFESFDQNWPTGSPCHVVKHSYDGVLGWLVPQGAVAPVPTSDFMPLDQTVRIIAAVNVRTAPRPDAPIAGVFRPGTAHINGVVTGVAGTVANRTSKRYLKTDGGNYFNSAAAAGTF